MSKSKNDISQIKKYLQGGLDSHAMHELERRALDDPFLADALEGYEKAGTQQQKNLDELSGRLQSRVDKKVRSIMPWAQLSIAASVLIIIGIGVWLVARNKTEKPNLVAATVKNEKPPQPTISAPSTFATPVTTDTTSKPKAGASRSTPDNVAAKAPSLAELSAANKQPQVGAAGTKSDTANAASINLNAPVAKEKATLANAEQAQYKSTDKQALNEVIVQDDSKKTVYGSSQSVKKATPGNPETQLQGHVDGLDVQPAHKTLTGYVTSANGGQPLIGAVVKLAGANFGAVTDANGKFVLHDVPEKKNLVVNYLGYNAKQVKVNASDSVNVALEPASSALSEVVTSSPKAKKAQGGSSPSAEAHPSAGWKAFTDYLNKNAVLPDGETGKVQLSFMVDGKGSLSGFTIIKSLNATADQKAIDLITNGPGWAGNIDGQPHEVKLTVRFH
ncbi:MAG TPA: carboxypeptidase-like regulatory domain-containing protein [Mucilaginibacter sp.]|nr:carboxypeptidase-like regulatory domain-containing protein [Mucilaginibacter sp.]